MDPTTIRVISGILFVVIVFVIFARRKKMAEQASGKEQHTERVVEELPDAGTEFGECVVSHQHSQPRTDTITPGTARVH